MTNSRSFQRIIDSVTAVINRCLALEKSFELQLNEILPEQQASARNLIHYLALRQHDIRSLQIVLSSYGLTSLGGTEAHVLASLLTVRTALRLMAGEKSPERTAAAVDFSSGPALLQGHTQRLLGSSHASHPVRVMVTTPSEAATDYELVRDLVGAGMDIMRVNCAHDDEAAWSGMIANLERANREFSRRCRILMDLGGPKLRTGALAGGLRVLKIRPKRDSRDQLLEPVRVFLTGAEGAAAPVTGGPVVPLTGIAIDKLRVRDKIRFTDIRGRQRMLTITGREKGGCWAESAQAAMLESGMVVAAYRRTQRLGLGEIGVLPEVEQPLVLHRGDLLEVTGPATPGRAAELDDKGEVKRPATIPTTLPEVFKFVKAGERIFFDDGKIGGIVKSVTKRKMTVEITYAAHAGGKLRSDKGINLPDTDLDLPALTPKDFQDLQFAARHADMVGLSFVRHPKDIELLQRELQRLDSGDVGIVLKIENRVAFENLPHLLLQGLQTMPLGVMVARGDLAVEVGFERLAELQEEILWLCEAAHVPVIWATQVLENMAKTGMPSRAEVTDAAMSGRAECVMLNKGPYIVDAVKFLEDVLERMKRHQRKKASMLRRLSISDAKPRTKNEAPAKAQPPAEPE
ncbi:MAG: pyruvate kinase [Acidobacteria bacterium]|nr:pyruvate kinase [Acidobacteriota bacterium]